MPYVQIQITHRTKHALEITHCTLLSTKTVFCTIMISHHFVSFKVTTWPRVILPDISTLNIFLEETFRSFRHSALRSSTLLQDRFPFVAFNVICVVGSV